MINSIKKDKIFNIKLKETIKNIDALLSMLSRESKEKLKLIIESRTYNEDEIKIAIKTICPSYERTVRKTPSLSTDDYEKSIEVICDIIRFKKDVEKYKGTNTDIDLSIYYETYNIIQRNISNNRKREVDLYIKPIKTNLTTEQYERFCSLMRSYNYKSQSSFLRDVAIADLDIKPNEDELFKDYLLDTKRLSESLSNCHEDIQISRKQPKLIRYIKQLDKNVRMTRKLAVESHSSSTAKILALKYLSSKELFSLYEEKTKAEDNQ